jgi:hypothetical protein
MRIENGLEKQKKKMKRFHNLKFFEIFSKGVTALIFQGEKRR